MKRHYEFEKSNKADINKEIISYQNVLLNIVKSNTNYINDKIEIFEDNLIRLGLDENNKEEKTKENNKNMNNMCKSGTNQLKMSAELGMKKFKEKLQMKEDSKKEKSIRDRVISAKQIKAKSELENNKKVKSNEDNSINNTNNTGNENIINTNKITASNYCYKFNFSKRNKNVNNVNLDGLLNFKGNCYNDFEDDKLDINYYINDSEDSNESDSFK